MKIPQIHGRNKIRDTKICRDYIQESLDPSELCEKYDLSLSTMYRILYRNRQFLLYDKNWEKVKRVQWLKKQLKKKTSSRKDGADIVDQLRREIEGDKVTQEIKQVEYRKIEIVVTRDKTTLLSPSETRRSIQQ